MSFRIRNRETALHPIAHGAIVIAIAWVVKLLIVTFVIELFTPLSLGASVLVGLAFSPFTVYIIWRRNRRIKNA